MTITLKRIRGMCSSMTPQTRVQKKKKKLGKDYLSFMGHWKSQVELSRLVVLNFAAIQLGKFLEMQISRCPIVPCYSNCDQLPVSLGSHGSLLIIISDPISTMNQNLYSYKIPQEMYMQFEKHYL